MLALVVAARGLPWADVGALTAGQLTPVLLHLFGFAIVGFALAAGPARRQPGRDFVLLAMVACGFELAQAWTDPLGPDDLMDLGLNLAGVACGVLAAHLCCRRPGAVCG